ncbi:hypothetical protein FN846DRAFT_903795 [Sphaerosporella brunnea]|uniref:Uncharacterized protein n=1 Tax=Sphaerosporella brunnea TaxID=1250544 RepID=A0A5J5F5T0_9PEZI|nr:hypothetical protein FN846DRAFT_903795 [Sphaerosporella brunnea]
MKTDHTASQPARNPVRVAEKRCRRRRAKPAHAKAKLDSNVKDKIDSDAKEPTKTFTESFEDQMRRDDLLLQFELQKIRLDRTKPNVQLPADEDNDEAVNEDIDETVNQGESVKPDLDRTPRRAVNAIIVEKAYRGVSDYTDPISLLHESDPISLEEAMASSHKASQCVLDFWVVRLLEQLVCG